MPALQQPQPSRVIGLLMARTADVVSSQTQKPGTDSNGTTNTAIIAVLSVIGGIFFLGIIYMLWAYIANRAYGEEIDDD